MDTLYVDPAFDDDARRRAQFDGQFLVHSNRASVVRLVAHARGKIEEAFGALDPEVAQASMEVTAYAALLADLKPRFIHHPTSKDRIRDMLEDLGANLETTYFDVPRMRSSTSDNYLFGTTLGDFLRATDLEHLPAELIARCDIPRSTALAR